MFMLIKLKSKLKTLPSFIITEFLLILPDKFEKE